jgi:hypothetical protein
MTHLGGIAAAIFTVLVLPAAAPQAPGDLDPSFGDGGRAFVSVGEYALETKSVLQSAARS